MRHPFLTLIPATLLLTACTATPKSPSAAGPTHPTPEQAKQALLTLIRTHPETFIGNPDPDRFTALPLTTDSPGQYSLGAFHIDTTHNRYSADIGSSSPEPFFYNGDFQLDKNTWTAAAPTVTRMHHLPS